MLSIIIGCQNERDNLKKTLEAACAIESPNGGLEISIFDDGSSDGCTDFLDHSPWIEQRQQGFIRLQRSAEKQGISRGRHKAAIGCRGDVLIFMDAHLTFPQADLWRQIENHFEQNTSDLLAIDCRNLEAMDSGGGFAYTSKRLCHQHTNWVWRSNEALVGDHVPYVNGGFFAIRRKVYERLKGFPLFLEGWGHEDRYLSMLAGYFGFRCAVNQSLIVGHLYGRDSSVLEDKPLIPCSDPSLTQDGVPKDLQQDFIFCPDRNSDPEIPKLLLNSLRCGEILYSSTVLAQLHEQMASDYGADLLNRALKIIAVERPQLNKYMQNIGLNALERDQAMHRFFAQYRPFLPMLVEAELQSLRYRPSSQALSDISKLPTELHNLPEEDYDQYSIARFYLEGTFAYQEQQWLRASSCFGQSLSIDPDYLPAIWMMAETLRIRNKVKPLRFWLEHGATVIEKHRGTYGHGPIQHSHPSSINYYLRHLFFPEVDRLIWLALSDLETRSGNRVAASHWLTKLLEQRPDDEAVLTKMRDLYSSTADSQGHDPREGEAA